jgi:hypothetical protein
MILSESQALTLLKSPANRAKIEAARNQESALRVFTEEMDENELKGESYWAKFQSALKSKSEKKYQRVSQFMRFPLPVVQITDSILNDFYKVFEGKNRYFDESSANDIQALSAWISETQPQDWILRQAKEVFKNKPSSFVVVDRDAQGVPYLISVDSSRVYDAEFVKQSKDGQLEYIIFIHSVEKGLTDDDYTTYYSVYDQENYYVYSKSSKAESYTLFSSTQHNLGYCPARAFINDSSNTKNPFKRKSVFGQSLSKLEDWTTFDIYRNFTDHYAPFPVTEAPKRKCANTRCKDGTIEDEEVIDRATGEKRTIYKKCSVCADESDLIGPGTHIKIKLQTSKEAEDGSGKFKMHFPDTDKMKYIPEKLDDLELEIRFKTVGVSSVLQKEAVNEMQVKGSFASMEAILIRNKNILDSIYQWSVSTVAKLLYPNFPIKIEGNFGTEFYLVSESELQERFEKAKAIGLPKSELMMIFTQLVETKYKGNPSKILRAKMLLALEPMPFMDEEKAIILLEKAIITQKDIYFKINFYTFVDRFEQENTLITEFGLELDMWERLKKIKETLTIYNDEYYQSKQLQASIQGIRGDRSRAILTSERGN